MKWGDETHDLVGFVAMMADECQPGRYDCARVLKEVGHPEFGTVLGGWRDRVPDGFKANWDALPLSARLCIFAMAIGHAT